MAANPCVGKVTYKPAPSLFGTGELLSTCRQRERLARYTCSRTRGPTCEYRPQTDKQLPDISCELIGLKADGRGLFVEDRHRSITGRGKADPIQIRLSPVIARY